MTEKQQKHIKTWHLGQKILRIRYHKNESNRESKCLVVLAIFRHQAEYLLEKHKMPYNYIQLTRSTGPNFQVD